MSTTPTIGWAQRLDKLYLNVELPDPKDVDLRLEPDGFSVFATKDDVHYEAEIELFDNVDVEGSKFHIVETGIVYVIQKAEKKWWTRLYKQQGKPPAFIKFDRDILAAFDDEDDENDEGRTVDFSKFKMARDDPDEEEFKDEDDEAKPSTSAA
ncbi:hypothetical protein P3X46_008833 [Hevea brasiliensis]|uniref:Co-chaperone protein p23 n=1 Tax=Hevea brasiliensis TaxID=3981 RepID=A0ABQ9MLW5_HEVBR|nr:co-chaperone protein p23-1-like [Hevea brasiliensis]KAJ9180615.1 hypothetical protein P3X46_008833 [Hevea brasiliensis]